jgi:hypothetical protein
MAIFVFFSRTTRAQIIAPKALSSVEINEHTSAKDVEQQDNAEALAMHSSPLEERKTASANNEVNDNSVQPYQKDSRLYSCVGFFCA